MAKTWHISKGHKAVWLGDEVIASMDRAGKHAMGVAKRLLLGQAKANLNGHKSAPGAGYHKKPGALRDVLRAGTWETPDGNYGAVVIGEFPTFQVDKGHKVYKGRKGKGRRENREVGRQVKGLHHVTNAPKQQRNNITRAFAQAMRTEGLVA